MKKLIYVICVMLFIVTSSSAQEKDSKALMGQKPLTELNKIDLWRKLDPGIYSVGYKVIYEYDYNRTIKSKYNYKKELITENNYRPIQISIWYPAKIDLDSSLMSYSEYIITRGSRFDYSMVTQEAKKQIIDRYTNSVNFYNQSKTKNEDITDYIINRKTKAYKNATPKKGNFPLIIFCSGGGDTPDSFDVLFEYLASHGYVIAAIPSNGMFNNQPSYNLIDEESQIRDMEFAMSYMRNFPNADINNVCSMGYSYGGIINVLFALRNFDIKAVLCLDGSICLKDRDRSVKILPYFNPSRLKIPFMNMARKVHDEQDFNFYNNLKYSDAYLLHFNQMEHYEFTSRPLVRDFESINSKRNENVISIGRDNELVYVYSLHFLNAYTKDDITSLSFIQNNPEQNGISKRILEIDLKKSMEIPPTGKNFCEYIKNEGVEKGLQVYYKAKDNDPEIVLFDRNEINSFGYEFLDEGKIEDAIKIFQLFVLEYPEISNSYDSLGEAFAKNKNYKEALYNYRKALKINPDSQSAARAIERLEKLQEKDLKKFPE